MYDGGEKMAKGKPKIGGCKVTVFEKKNPDILLNQSKSK